MLGGRGRTKRAVGSMRGLKVPKRGLAKLRMTKALRGAMKKKAKGLKTPSTPSIQARRVPATPATPRSPQPQRTPATPRTPRRRSPFRRRASAQQRVALGAARGRPRVQARRG